jgi:hypothetical protein
LRGKIDFGFGMLNFGLGWMGENGREVGKGAGGIKGVGYLI